VGIAAFRPWRIETSFPQNATWPHNKHVTGANAAVRVVIVVFDGVKLLDAAVPAAKP
jgi:hypothetical protein